MDVERLPVDTRLSCRIYTRATVGPFVSTNGAKIHIFKPDSSQNFFLECLSASEVEPGVCMQKHTVRFLSAE